MRLLRVSIVGYLLVLLLAVNCFTVPDYLMQSLKPARQSDDNVLESLVELKKLLALANHHEDNSKAAGELPNLGTIIQAAKRLQCLFDYKKDTTTTTTPTTTPTTTTTTTITPLIPAATAKVAIKHDLQTKKVESSSDSPSRLDRLKQLFSTAYRKVKTHLKPNELAMGLQTILKSIDDTDDTTLGKREANKSSMGDLEFVNRVVPASNSTSNSLDMEAAMPMIKKLFENANSTQHSETLTEEETEERNKKAVAYTKLEQLLTLLLQVMHSFSFSHTN